MGEPVRMSKFATTHIPIKYSMDFISPIAGRWSGCAYIVPTNAGYKISAITRPIPLPVNKRKAFEGTYRCGKWGNSSRNGGKYKYEFSPSTAYVIANSPRTKKTRWGGNPERRLATMAWKSNPIIAPIYWPVHRAQSGSCRIPKWKERTSIRWQTAYPTASAFPKIPGGVSIHQPNSRTMATINKLYLPLLLTLLKNIFTWTINLDYRWFC